MEDIYQWHCMSGHAMPDSIHLDPAVIERRATLIREEAREVMESLRKLRVESIASHLAERGDSTSIVAAVSKELADLYWVTVGAMLEIGLPMDEIMREVSASNWSKITCPDCGGCGDQHGADRTCSACRGSGIKLERDENGKIRKGPNYRPADLGQIIADAMPGGEGE